MIQTGKQDSFVLGLPYENAIVKRQMDTVESRHDEVRGAVIEGVVSKASAVPQPQTPTFVNGPEGSLRPDTARRFVRAHRVPGGDT
jgi:hypothetical protein